MAVSKTIENAMTDCWLSSQSPDVYVFYNPLPLRVQSILITNRDMDTASAVKAITMAEISGSNDGLNYSLISTVENETHLFGGETWRLPVDSTEYYKYYKMNCVGDDEYVSIAEMKINAVYSTD